MPRFLEKTNLKMVKETTFALCEAVPIEVTEYGIVSHPFTNCVMTAIMDENNNCKFVDLRKKEDCDLWKNYIKQVVNKAKNSFCIMTYLNTAYYLTWFKFVCEYFSKDVFSKIFRDVWILSENPNSDVNVSLKESISYFKKADKKILMDDSEYEKFENFQKGLTVYRGVAVDRNPNGLSWTTSFSKAEWFANRFNRDTKKGYIQKLVIKDKRNILAYFATRGEEEVVVDTFKEKDFEIISQ